MQCRAALAVASLFAGMAVHQPATFHTETPLVVLHVTVTNRQGELVTNLARDAFSVFEDGRRQTIALFRRNDVPTSLGLIIDNSGSMRPMRRAVEAAALAFVRASNPQDEVFVVNFADTPRIDVPFTSDLHRLESGVAREDAIGGTAVRDAIQLGALYLRDHATRDRRALLVISDGKDNASGIPASLLRKNVEQYGASIFSVDVAHANPTAERHGNDDELERLAARTGGVMYRVKSVSDITRAVLDVAYQIRNEYTIGYTPANEMLDGTYRRVRVKVTGPGGLTGRTRQGYWAAARP